MKSHKNLKKIIVLSVCGALIGFLNGFFGGGGGIVCVPLIEKVLHLENKYSHATTIAIILPISLASSIIYLFSGSLKTVPLLTVLSGSIVGGIVGAIALKYLPSKYVRFVFAALMLAGGIGLLI